MTRVTQPASISSTHFNISEKRKLFTAFDSDFGSSGLQVGPLYLDAADLGFVMVSAVTQAKATFFLEQEHVTNGEITHWTFKPTGGTLQKHPQLAGAKIQLWNG